MTLDDLICKMECEEVILNHARHLDLGELTKAREAFTQDATFVTPTGETVRTADIKEEEQRVYTANLYPRIVTNIVVTPTGPDTADARCYITLPRDLIAQGEWLYKLRKTPEGWRICHHVATGIERNKGDFEKLRAQSLARRAAAAAQG